MSYMVLSVCRVFLRESHSPVKMIWAAFTLAFFGFLRISEFTCDAKSNPKLHLTSSDIKFIPSPAFPRYMRVEIKASETDPFCKGMSLIIGQTLQTICPVRAMKEYLDILPQTWTGPLFTYSSERRLNQTASLQVNSELSLVVWASISPIMRAFFEGKSCNIRSCVRPPLLAD